MADLEQPGLSEPPRPTFQPSSETKEESLDDLHTTPPPPPADSRAAFMKRKEKEGSVGKIDTVLTFLALVFSALSLVLMGLNRHGYVLTFKRVPEYRCLFYVAAMAFGYSLCRLVLKARPLAAFTHLMISRRLCYYIDLFCIQMVAYLLISASAVAIPITVRLHEMNTPGKGVVADACLLLPRVVVDKLEDLESISAKAVEKFVEEAAASTGMAFLAFTALAASSVLSWFQFVKTCM